MTADLVPHAPTVVVLGPRPGLPARTAPWDLELRGPLDTAALEHLLKRSAAGGGRHQLLRHGPDRHTLRCTAVGTPRPPRWRAVSPICSPRRPGPSTPHPRPGGRRPRLGGGVRRHRRRDGPGRGPPGTAHPRDRPPPPAPAPGHRARPSDRPGRPGGPGPADGGEFTDEAGFTAAVTALGRTLDAPAGIHLRALLARDHRPTGPRTDRLALLAHTLITDPASWHTLLTDLTTALATPAADGTFPTALRTRPGHGPGRDPGRDPPVTAAPGPAASLPRPRPSVRPRGLTRSHAWARKLLLARPPRPVRRRAFPGHDPGPVTALDPVTRAGQEAVAPTAATPGPVAGAPSAETAPDRLRPPPGRPRHLPRLRHLPRPLTSPRPRSATRRRRGTPATPWPTGLPVCASWPPIPPRPGTGGWSPSAGPARQPPPPGRPVRGGGGASAPSRTAPPPAPGPAAGAGPDAAGDSAPATASQSAGTAGPAPAALPPAPGTAADTGPGTRAGAPGTGCDAAAPQPAPGTGPDSPRCPPPKPVPAPARPPPEPVPVPARPPPEPVPAPARPPPQPAPAPAHPPRKTSRPPPRTSLRSRPGAPGTPGRPRPPTWSGTPSSLWTRSGPSGSPGGWPGGWRSLRSRC